MRQSLRFLTTGIFSEYYVESANCPKAMDEWDQPPPSELEKSCTQLTDFAIKSGRGVDFVKAFDLRVDLVKAEPGNLTNQSMLIKFLNEYLFRRGVEESDEVIALQVAALRKLVRFMGELERKGVQLHIELVGLCNLFKEDFEEEP